MKVSVLCNSDVLAFPLVQHLHQNNMLVGIGVPVSTAAQLVPAFQTFQLPRVFKQETLEKELEKWISESNADLMLVLTFPWRIPMSVTKLPRLGMFNFHFGMLPTYSGADPIFWQIRNGEPKAAITVHKIMDIIDGGAVLLKDEINITPGSNYGILSGNLSMQAIRTFEKMKAEFRNGTIEFEKQNVAETDYVKAPSPADLKIDWQNHTAEEIENLVNAANPKYNGAITSLQGRPIRILEVSPVDFDPEEGSDFEPGEIVYADLVNGIIAGTCDRDFLKIGVVILSEGYFSGSKLFSLGFQKGNKFK